MGRGITGRRTRVHARSIPLVIGLVLAGCSPPAATQSSPPVATSAAPVCTVARPGVGGPAGTVIYQDAMNDPCGGWPTVQPGPPTAQQSFETIQGYEQGGYRVFVGGVAPTDHWTGPDGLDSYGLLADIRVEVEAKRVGGPDRNLFGVICRVVLRGPQLIGGYGFYIGSDGRYAISRRNRAMNDFLAEGVAPNAIDGNGVNRVRADCVGTKLTLYSNDKKLAEVDDSTFPQGLTGVVARSVDTSGVDIVFRNFVLTKP